MKKNLKNLLLLVTLFSFYGNYSYCQQVQRESIGTLGGSSLLGNTYIHECTGQPFFTHSNSTSVVNVLPGFVQPLVEIGITVKDELEFIAYPNPVKDILNIKWTNESNYTTIRVYNVQGILVRTVKVNLSTNTQLNIQNMPSGMYILEVQQKTTVNRVSIIKI